MSKQLDSILGRATRATPEPRTAPEPPVPTEAMSGGGEGARALQARVAETVQAPPAAQKRAAEVKTKPKATDPSAAATEPAHDIPERPAEAMAEPQRPIQAVVPVSVARALAVKAAMEDTTVRDLILRGLAAIGLDVPEDECRDRRR